MEKNQNISNRNFKKQMFDLLTSNIVDKLLNSINVYILIAWIGLSGFGTWSVLMSVLLIFDSVFSMGVSTYSLEYLIQTKSRNKFKKLIYISCILLIIKFLFLIFFSLVKDYKFLDPIGGNLTLINLGLFLCFQEVAKILQSICQINNITQKILYSRLIQSVIRTSFLLVFFYKKLPSIFAPFPYILSVLCCCIFLLIFSQKNSFKFNFNSLKNMIIYYRLNHFYRDFIPFIKNSFPFAISAMTILLYLKSDILCLQYFSIEESKIGNYSFASSLASSVYFIPFNAYRVLLSSFNGTNLKSVLSKYKKRIFFVCFLILILQQFTYFGINAYLPKSYPEIIFNTVNLLTILSFGLFGICLNEYSALSFALINKNWLINLRSLLTFSANISLNLLLIPIFGIFGAAIGTTLALISSGLFMLFLKIYTYKHLRINNYLR